MLLPHSQGFEWWHISLFGLPYELLSGVLNKLFLLKRGNAFPNRRSRFPSHEFCQLMSLGCGYLYCYKFLLQYISRSNLRLLIGGEGDQSFCVGHAFFPYSLVYRLTLHPFGASVAYMYNWGLLVYKDVADKVGSALF